MGAQSAIDKIEQLSQENHDLVLKEYGKKAKARNFFSVDADLLHQLPRSTFDDAKDIYLSGMSLRRTIRTLQPTLGSRITAGAHVRVIILDGKNNKLMEELVLRSAGAKKVKGWQEVLESVHDDVQTIIQGLPKNSKGSIEIGYLPYVPSFGIVLINPNGRNGRGKSCFVELYHHRSTEANPSFEINYENDEAWHKFFVNQYDLLWKSCSLTEKYPK